MKNTRLHSIVLSVLLAGCAAKAPHTWQGAGSSAAPTAATPNTDVAADTSQVPPPDQAAAKAEAPTLSEAEPATSPGGGALNAPAVDDQAVDAGPLPPVTASSPMARRQYEHALHSRSAGLTKGLAAASPTSADTQPATPPANYAAPTTGVIWQSQPPSGEGYTPYLDNGTQDTAQNPVSTFGLDVDTGSFSNVRRFLDQGQMPPPDAVRAEELINYFSYDYPAPERGRPFAVSTELGQAPWNAGHWLLRVAVKAVGQTVSAMPPANLVFLVDVSGSMDEPDKLPLVRNALKLLTTRLRPQDRVAIVAYAGDTHVVLPSTPGSFKSRINNAIDQLQAGGSTNGEAGIDMAYGQARIGFIPGGINRILLATDGDFNVGVTDIDQLKALISSQRQSGISLTTLGVGQGNYQEPVMQQLADAGSGNYAYLDSLDEARKVLLEQLSSTLDTMASDVKLQMEFNPRQIAQWRLIGYEKRALQEQDFRNDQVAGGEVGAGKSVVALYELTPAEQRPQRRYAAVENDASAGMGTDGELGYLKIRYKSPDHARVCEMQHALRRDATARPGSDWRFAAAVAGFAQLLRGVDLDAWSWQDARALAAQGLGRDEGGYRQDFVRMIDLAAAIAPTPPRVGAVDQPTWQGE